MRRPVATILLIIVVAAAAYAFARLKRDFWDFDVLRTAGARALAAEPLYRPQDGHYQYKYWPAFALAMAPFGALPAEAGKVVWYGLTLGLIAVYLTQSVRGVPDRRATTRWLTWWTLLLTGKFFVKELVNGQTNVLLGVTVLAAVASARAGRHVRAGMLVGLAAFAKPYALIFLPWLAVSFGVAAGGATLATLVAGWAAPAVVYGWSGNVALHLEWYRTVVQTTSPNLLFPENISFAAMWAKWLGPGTAATALAGATAVASVAIGAWLWICRRSVKEPAFLEIGYLLLLVPLISPQGWDYVLLLATPAIVCLLDRFGRMPMTWRLLTAAGFFLTSFTIYDLLGRALYLELMSVSAITVGALLLAASLARLRVTGSA